MDNYEHLRPFAATLKQTEILDALRRADSVEDAAQSLGNKVRGVYAALGRIRSNAAVRGVAPEFDMQHQAADPFLVNGTSTLYDDEGQVKIQWVKTALKKDQALQHMRDAIVESMEDFKGAHKPRVAPRATEADMMTCYPMGDPHIGMYAWREECGEDFDVKIAREDLLAATSRLVSVAPATEKALILNLGDFFHADNAKNTTTRGTFQDVDTRWPQVLQVGCMIMVDLVTMALAKHQQVDVINCIGNHDDHSSVMLAAFMDAWFHNEPRVNIYPTVSKFHFYTFGKVMIGATHGDTVKMTDLAEIMAADEPSKWAATEHRYWYTGHIHHKQKLELRGCVTESFRTLAGSDSWHRGQGYRSGRDMYAIVHHKDYGEVERYRCDIRQARPLKSDG